MITRRMTEFQGTICPPQERSECPGRSRPVGGDTMGNKDGPSSVDSGTLRPSVPQATGSDDENWQIRSSQTEVTGQDGAGNQTCRYPCSIGPCNGLPSQSATNGNSTSAPQSADDAGKDYPTANCCPGNENSAQAALQEFDSKSSGASDSHSSGSDEIDIYQAGNALLTLPTDLLLRIARYLPCIDRLNNLPRVCRRFADLCRQNRTMLMPYVNLGLQGFAIDTNIWHWDRVCAWLMTSRPRHITFSPCGLEHESQGIF